MNKKVKLIIEIAVFVVLLVVIACIYNFSDSNREELEAEAGNVGVVKITDENFNQEVIESDKPVILEFSSNSCPPCVAMLTTLIDIAKNNKEIKVATINVDAKDSADTLARYPVDGTPTIMIFEDGQIKSTLVGAVDETTIMNELK